MASDKFVSTNELGLEDLIRIMEQQPIQTELSQSELDEILALPTGDVIPRDPAEGVLGEEGGGEREGEGGEREGEGAGPLRTASDDKCAFDAQFIFTRSTQPSPPQFADLFTAQEYQETLNAFNERCSKQATMMGPAKSHLPMGLLETASHCNEGETALHRSLTSEIQAEAPSSKLQKLDPTDQANWGRILCTRSFPNMTFVELLDYFKYKAKKGKPPDWSKYRSKTELALKKAGMKKERKEEVSRCQELPKKQRFKAVATLVGEHCKNRSQMDNQRTHTYAVLDKAVAILLAHGRLFIEESAAAGAAEEVQLLLHQTLLSNLAKHAHFTGYPNIH